MKIFVTGSSGLIGRQLTMNLMSTDNEIFSSSNTNKSEFGIPLTLDLTNFSKVNSKLDDIKPDVIVHLAALTNVDECEENHLLADKLNVEATKLLCKKAQQHGSFFIYMSTDYVFDGKIGMKKESDTTNPINYYGKTKFQAEKIVQSLDNFSIVRTSTPFGFHPRKVTFLHFIINNLKQNNPISVVKDQYTSSIFVPNLSSMIIELIEKQLNGIFHLASSNQSSRYDIGKMVAKKMNLDENLIKPILMSDLPWKAPRPQYSTLDVSKVKSILETKPLSINDGLNSFIEQIKFSD